jgi:soluble lytic murein transglycosylase-like protein
MTKPRLTRAGLWRCLPWAAVSFALLSLVAAAWAWTWAVGGARPPEAASLEAAASVVEPVVSELEKAPAPRVPEPGVAAPRTAVPAARPPAPPAPVRRSALTTAASRAVAAGEFAYAEMVRRVARRHSVEWRLVAAIIASESGGDPNAVSPAGAVGLMQLMPDTADRLGVDPYDPEQNVEGAVRYLATLLSTFKSVDLTLVAYNAGPGFAIKYKKGDAELGAETREFLMRVGDLLQAHHRRETAPPGPEPK